MSQLTETRITFAGEDPSDRLYTSADLKRYFAYFRENYGAFLPESKDASVLDFGCGAGTFFIYLEKEGYRDLQGFEPDTRYAVSARHHTRAVIESEKEGSDFLLEKKGQFDFILCRQVLYYLPKEKMAQTVKDLKSALKPGGTLILEVYNAAGLTGLWPRINDLYIQAAFSEHSLSRLVDESGLKILSLETEKIPTHSIKMAFWKLARSLWWNVVKLIFILERGFDPLNPKKLGKNLILVAQNC